MENQQSSYLISEYDFSNFETIEDSTTIPQGSTGRIKSIRKRTVYLKDRFVVYKITNKTTNKFYIGSASYYDKRMGTHVSRLRRNDHDNNHLQASWNKYGESNFIFEIIERCTKETLLTREQFWLDLTQCYNSNIGYNINKRAESRKGGVMPDSAKIKIGNFWRGKKFSEERIRNIRDARTKEQGVAIEALRLIDNKRKTFVSISEASRELNVSIAAISKQCSRNRKIIRRRKDSLYQFKYKDIV